MDGQQAEVVEVPDDLVEAATLEWYLRPQGIACSSAPRRGARGGRASAARFVR